MTIKNNDDIIITLVEKLLFPTEYLVNINDDIDEVEVFLKDFLWGYSEDVVWLQNLWVKQPEIKDDYLSDPKFCAMTTTLDTPMGLIAQIADREARVGQHTASKYKPYCQLALKDLTGWPSIEIPVEICNCEDIDPNHPLYKRLFPTSPPLLGEASFEEIRSKTLARFSKGKSSSISKKLDYGMHKLPKHVISIWQEWSKLVFQPRLNRVKTEAHAIDLLLLNQKESFIYYIIEQFTIVLSNVDDGK